MASACGILALAGCQAGQAALQGSSAAEPVQNSVGAGAEWTRVNADSDETGFSRLDQINVANAGALGLAWSLDLPGEASLEAPPLFVDGVLYFTGSYAGVYAVDAASGKLLWKYDPKTWQYNPDKMGWANRGVAYDAGKVFVGANDGRLIALDARTGGEVWSVDTTDRRPFQNINGAPRVFNGKVIVGQGGADSGARGYVTAYDEATGRQVWRFYIVPGSPEQNAGDPAMVAAAKTWPADFWKTNGGGGGPWDNITFDAALNRVYIGTANAYDYDPVKRDPEGRDNLYTASIVALDADTGKYAWHYQVNPRDSWDYDCTQQMMLATLIIDGRPRRVLMQAPKNGFFYVIDRDTGKLISAEKIGKVTWADRIDVSTGRPVERANIRYESGVSDIFPFTSGAHSYMRMAFNPRTGLVYVPYMQMGTRFSRGQPSEGDLTFGGLNIGDSPKTDADDGKGAIVAWDPVAQKERWRVRFDTLWNGGIVATAGNVVFMGAADGYFYAFDATTGRQLWRFNADMGIIASPTTWSLGGKQYVSVLAGYGASAAIQSSSMNVGWKYAQPRRLLTFALGGTAALPASHPPTTTIQPLDNPEERLDPMKVAMGKAMFIACAACHGKQVVGAGGPAPDLRESGIPLDAEAFQQVVIGGALKERGMPPISFYKPEQVEAIRQYIRSRARTALTEQ
ncbi:MAG: PQQ-dependent dehydrogenase, methanol/ethanol family [Novosphingobium sp.]